LVECVQYTLGPFGTDVIVSSHDHDYEQFAPQTSADQLDWSRGIREFVVGTGGDRLRPFATVKPNGRLRNASTHGVLKNSH
jgi:hypothetical protein